MQKIIDVVQDTEGRTICGAQVEFLNYPSLTTASVYATDGGTVNINPLTTDDYGEYSGYLANGRYSKRVYIGGVLQTASNQDDVILFDPADAIGRSVKEFGAKGDGVTDDTAAIAAARAWLATNRGRLIFPSGTYVYSVSPNWAIHHSEVVFEGDCVLRYTGTGNAAIFDGTAADAVGFSSTQVMQVKWGWGSCPAIEAPNTAQNGMFVKAVHHAKIGGRVRGAGTTYSGLRVEYAVCTEFDVRVTVNQDGWYLSAKPENGIFLGAPASGTWAGVPTSYCTFVQPIAEGTNIGIYLSATLGNNFFGGTAEACTQYGVYHGVNANQDKFYGTDFEANTTADVYSLGDSLTLSDCDSENIITFGTSARRCVIRGGLHSAILLDTSSTNCTVTDVYYNRFNDGSTMNDAGTRNVVTNARNLGTGEKYLTGSSVSAGVAGIANGTTTSITGVAVVACKLGDFVKHSYSVAHPGLTRTAEVSSDGFVRAVFTNNSGGTVNLPAGTLYLEIERR